VSAWAAEDLERFARDRFHTGLAAAFVRGRLADVPLGADDEELCALGAAAGLRLHRFKRMQLPRVARVLGVLRGVQPRRLLDIGTGRGAFLWPLLEAFPALEVTAVDVDERRVRDLETVARGGERRLSAVQADARRLPFADRSFDVVCALEVLEHLDDPAPAAREVLRTCERFAIVSAPSHEDDNAEHVQLFTKSTMESLLRNAGAASVNTNFVLNHLIAVARPAR
jgi:ubiquinone/menaquinone biosynthesis C-methylase UbiE